MLTTIPSVGEKVWMTDVVDKNGVFDGKFKQVPRQVIFQYVDRGMIWFTLYDGAHPFGWYSSQFFDTEEETLAECELLEQEAAGVVTERMEAWRAKCQNRTSGESFFSPQDK